MTGDYEHSPEDPTPSETGEPSAGGWPMAAKFILFFLLVLFAVLVGLWAWGPWK